MLVRQAVKERLAGRDIEEESSDQRRARGVKEPRLLTSMNRKEAVGRFRRERHCVKLLERQELTAMKCCHVVLS